VSFFLGGGGVGGCLDALVLCSISMTLLSIESIKTSKSQRRTQARETNCNTRVKILAWPNVVADSEFDTGYMSVLHIG
jgi:hypothetical protein